MAGSVRSIGCSALGRALIEGLILPDADCPQGCPSSSPADGKPMIGNERQGLLPPQPVSHQSFN